MSAHEVRCACGALNDVTFGSCIRCGRPLGAGQAGAPTARRPPLPRRVAEEGERGHAALWIGGLCSAVFMVQLTMALRNTGTLPLLSGGRTVDLWRVGLLHTSWDQTASEPFRLLAAVYVHIGLIHFVMNMMGLASTGRRAEHFVGTYKAVIAFVLAGVAGFAADLLLCELGWVRVHDTAGASGGIFGLLGLPLGALLRARDASWRSYFWSAIGSALIFGFLINLSRGPVMVNNAAHVGGLVVGFALGLLWGKGGPDERPWARTGAWLCTAASVLAIVLSLTSRVPGLLSPG